MVMGVVAPDGVNVTSLSSLSDSLSSSSIRPSQSLSLPSHTSGEPVGVAALHLRPAGVVEVSHTHLPVLVQPPLMMEQAVFQPKASSCSPSQSLSRPSQPLVVSSRSWYEDGYT